ncbi:MAG: DUF1957 domain-containing protein [Actinobacteria bacterium ATB1]|nr:DUF1957 domain-containing protein [Actinobacteria bacterium ATB1]
MHPRLPRPDRDMQDLNAVVPEGAGSPAGHFVLVLHTHLPWLKGAGRWPVGEEWLFQAWGEAYIPVLELLESQRELGRRGVLTLGLTPPILCQLEDADLIARFREWLGFAMLRCEMLAANAADWPDTQTRRDAAGFWWNRYRNVLRFLDAREGCLVPTLRALAEDGVIEILGGPLTHPYLPLLDSETVRAQLRLGLDVHEAVLGRRPEGIWLPECAYRPGLEDELEKCGVRHVVLDGPTVLQAGGFAALRHGWNLGSSRVGVVGRDLEVSYRVWSPTGGYPGRGEYREYHRWEWETGLKLWRVTDKSVAQDEKEWYDPDLVPAAVEADVADFHTVLRRSVSEPGEAVVACYDTELFGHWWVEGPMWLASLLDKLAEDDMIRPTTLGSYLAETGRAGTLEPPPGSWGLHKDFSVWDNEETAHMWDTLEEVSQRFRKDLADPIGRHPDLERRLLVQAARELFLMQSSDWPFMIGHDKSVEFAHERFDAHTDAASGCLEALETLRDGSFDGKGDQFESWLTKLEHEHGISAGLTVERLRAAHE